MPATTAAHRHPLDQGIRQTSDIQRRGGLLTAPVSGQVDRVGFEVFREVLREGNHVETGDDQAVDQQEPGTFTASRTAAVYAKALHVRPAALQSARSLKSPIPQKLGQPKVITKTD